MSRSLFTRMLALLLVLLIVLPVALADSFKATVYTSTMSVYAKNSTSSKCLGTLKQGTAFTVNAMKSGWAQISYKGKTGYVEIKNIKSSEHDKAYYTNKVTTVYKTASTSSKSIDKLTADYRVWVVGESGSFYLVDDYNGQFTGYVKKSCLSKSMTNPYAVSSSSKKTYKSNGATTVLPKSLTSTQSSVSKSMGSAKWREYVVYVAECKLGCAYKSTGVNNTTTFNNKSFVKTVYKSLGFSLPDSVSGIGNVAESKRISLNNLKKGDIVCFDSDKSSGDTVDMVGIYIGNGYFISASNTAGCVVLLSLNTSYYKNAFRWGRRVFN